MAAHEKHRPPDFSIIGAMRSGTSAIASSIAQHESIFITNPKEPSYFVQRELRTQSYGPGDKVFAERITTTEPGYMALFPNHGRTHCGDASTAYLYFSRDAAPRMFSWNPQMKIVALLRNPIDRAYSSYLYMRSRGREPIPVFEDALEAENKRYRAGWAPMWQYLQAGLYSQQLEPFFDLFPENQIIVYIFEDWAHFQNQVTKEIVARVGAQPSQFFSLTGQANASGSPRSNAISKFLFNPWSRRLATHLPRKFVDIARKGHERTLRQPPSLDPNTRDDLAHYYESEVRRLEPLLERNLDHWLHT